jgi:hypothetical protein
MRYAHVIDKICTNVSRWDRHPTLEEVMSYAPEQLVNVTDLAVGPGWGYVDGVWIPPEVPDDA